MCGVFKKEIMFNNISFLMKKQKKRIGEIEKAAGVSPGYISRAGKDEKARPGIDFIVKAADILGVSIDTLISVDLTKLTPTEEYLITFLDKLINDTTEDKLVWNCETEEYLNNKLEITEHGAEIYCEHPLFVIKGSYDEIKPGEGNVKVYFPSRAFKDNTSIARDCFYLEMKNRSRLYIMAVKDDRKTPVNELYELELWMYQESTGANYICGSFDIIGISKRVDALYSVVCENAKHLKIEKDVKEVMDAFMNNDLGENDDPYSTFV